MGDTGVQVKLSLEDKEYLAEIQKSQNATKNFFEAFGARAVKSLTDVRAAIQLMGKGSQLVSQIFAAAAEGSAEMRKKMAEAENVYKTFTGAAALPMANALMDLQKQFMGTAQQAAGGGTILGTVGAKIIEWFGGAAMKATVGYLTTFATALYLIYENASRVGTKKPFIGWDQAGKQLIATMTTAGNSYTRVTQKMEDAAKEAAKKRQANIAELDKIISDSNMNQLKSEDNKAAQIDQKEFETYQKIKEHTDKTVESQQKAEDARLAVAKSAYAERQKLANDEAMNMAKNITGFISSTGQMIGQVGQLYQMYYQNKQAALDNDLKRDMDAIAQRYDAEKTEIENTVANKAQRAAQLKALDDKRAREEKSAQEKIDKEKRKYAREAAKIQKQFMMYETMIATPSAAFQAFASAQWMPFPASAIVGGILATAATTLGGIKLKLISDMPLPAAAKGMYSRTPAIFGEAGPELAFPLASTQGRDAMKLMASQMLAAMEEKYGSVTERGGGMAPAGGKEIKVLNHIILEMNDQVLYDKVTDGMENGQIRVTLR